VSGAVFRLQSDAPALQVYEQVVPLQLAPDALTVLHTLPQAAQLLVVWSVVQVAPQSVSRHVHAPDEQSGVGWEQGVWFCQAPALQT
jgi:hypothetical protein